MLGSSLSGLTMCRDIMIAKRHNHHRDDGHMNEMMIIMAVLLCFFYRCRDEQLFNCGEYEFLFLSGRNLVA